MGSLNWEAIGAISETLGAVGVIVTLIYLAPHLKQHTLALKLNAEFSAAQEHVQNSIGVSGTNVPYTVLRGMEDPPKLSPEESTQFIFWINGSMRMYQHQHLKYLEGNLSSDSWSSTENLLKGFVPSKGFQSYWSSRRNTYSIRFQECVSCLDTSAITSSTEVMKSIQRKGSENDPFLAI